MEVVLLALTGGILGAALGAFGVTLLRILGTDQLPLGATIVFSHRTAIASIAAVILVTLVLAVPTIWFSLRIRLQPGFQMETRGGSTSRSARRMQAGFVVTQMALAMVLLTSAGMLRSSLKRALEVPPGFNPQNVITGSIGLPPTKYQTTSSRVAFVERLLERVRPLPSVSSAAIITHLPFTGSVTDTAVSVEGHVPKPGEGMRAHYLSGVTGDYWSAMQISLLRGRFITDADSHTKGAICVVDDAFAKTYWPDSDAVGRRVAVGAAVNNATAVTIVGVVGSVKQIELTEIKGHGAVYFPFSLLPSNSFSLVVRTTVAPTSIGLILQSALHRADPELPIDDLRLLQTRMDDSLIIRSSPTILINIFAASALLLAAIGTYGVISYTAGQQQREIGVRLALGAQPTQIRNQFIYIAVRLLIGGVLIGTAAALWSGLSLRAILFKVPAVDWTILFSAIGIMSVVALFAALFPAINASKMHPAAILRAD